MYREVSRIPKKPQRSSNTYALSLVAIVVIGLIFLGLKNDAFNMKIRPREEGTGKVQVIQTSTGSDQKNPQGRYLFNGTIFWGRAIEEWSRDTTGKVDYANPFSELSGFKRSSYDAWFADMECPITDKYISFMDQINTLQFSCPPQFLKEAGKYFDYFDLANNHSGDQGVAGYEMTKKNVADAGLKSYGSFDPGALNDTCSVTPLAVRVANAPAHIPVALCAWHYFYRTPLEGELEVMKQYQEKLPVFAFIHMGVEYLPEATDIQVDIAHKVADLGPEFVVANNPHWVQNTEVYKNKLIIYSTGNFIFDQLDYETQRSASLDADITYSSPQMQQWLDLGERCHQAPEKCWDMVQEAKLEKMTTSKKFDVVIGDSSKKRTRLGSETLRQDTLKRLKWQETTDQLKY
jgi:Bacterial capsule synthesis protein PGA_cap